MCSFSDTHQMPSKTRLIIAADEEEESINPLRFWDQVQALCFLSCSHTDIDIAQTSGRDITWPPRPWPLISVALEWQEFLEHWELKGSGCHPPG